MWALPPLPRKGHDALTPLFGDSDMKYIAMFLLCMVLAAPCFAGSCQDMQEAVSGAIQERNNRVSDSHDILMPDPETERDALSGCLGSVNAIGDAFSLGVTLPSMDQIVAGMIERVSRKPNGTLSGCLGYITVTGKSTRLTIRSTTPSTAWAATTLQGLRHRWGLCRQNYGKTSMRTVIFSFRHSVVVAGCGLCR